MNTSEETSEKQKFVDSLRYFAEEGGYNLYDPIYERWHFTGFRGDRIIADALATYLSNLSIPNESPGLRWLADLNLHLVDAFVEFRTHDKWQDLRAAYLRENGHEIPDLVDMHVGGIHRILICAHLAHLCSILTGEVWIKSLLETHFNAQTEVIDQTWRRFVRVAYRELMPRIKNETHRGNHGKFGTTELMTYCIAGRTMFTFRKGNHSVSFVADESDMYGFRSGMNATETPYQKCVSMIDEVIRNWELSKMVQDDGIGLG